MKAALLHRYGLRPTVGELPEPRPSEQQVLIRVRATSVNPIDWKQASGRYRPILTASFPFVPGYDVAGEVVETGPGVVGVSRGQRVHARLAGQRGGANAELAVAGTDVLTAMPDAMDFDTAAGLPLTGLTALQALRDVGGLAPGGPRRTVLIVGASGGVGHLAVQLARHFGATVTGLSSPRNHDLVRSLGASAMVDSSAPLTGLPPVDLIIDCVGGAPARFRPFLTPGGRYVSCVPGPRVFLASALNRLSSTHVKPVLMTPRAADLAFLDQLFRDGALRVIIDSTFPPEQLADAWTRSASGRTVGKIIVRWS